MSPQEIPRDPFPRLSSRSCLTMRTRVSAQPPTTTRPHPGESSAAVPACPSPLGLHPSLLVQGSVMLTWRPWAGQNGPTAPALSCSGFLWGGEGLEGRSQGPSACRVYTTGLPLNPDLPVPKPSLFTVYIIPLPDWGGQKRGGMEQPETRVPAPGPSQALKSLPRDPDGAEQNEGRGSQTSVASQPPGGLLTDTRVAGPSPEGRIQ